MKDREKTFLLHSTSLSQSQLPLQKMTTTTTLLSLWPRIWSSVSLVDCKKVATPILDSTHLHNGLYPLRLPSIKGFVSGCRCDGSWVAGVGTGMQTNQTDTTAHKHANTHLHTSVVLMAAFCWRGDWIRLGADCSPHWLMLPPALQCVTALPLLNTDETRQQL